ncbi:hypothetical protein PIB30_039782 [Stylosanthes scabra]|uniref:Uncharacterized protein n=1 Tax=Stylosanthes scabra TaxID=79078 RepID=A0ABU6WHX4_9FABA|nr:hypothetical protein [Stylosanthes scabra]
MAKSFNGVIVLTRQKPIYTKLEEIRVYLMTPWVKNCDLTSKLEGRGFPARVPAIVSGRFCPASPSPQGDGENSPLSGPHSRRFPWDLHDVGNFDTPTPLYAFP